MSTSRARVLPPPVDPPYLDAEASQALVNRLVRLEGHIRSIRRMVEDQRCADEILLQVAAVKGALNQFTNRILESELEACMSSCMEGEAEERLKKVLGILSALLKQS